MCASVHSARSTLHTSFPDVDDDYSYCHNMGFASLPALIIGLVYDLVLIHRTRTHENILSHIH